MTQLRTRRLGRTSLLVTELGFGAASVADVPRAKRRCSGLSPWEAEANVTVASSYRCMTPVQRERLRKRAQAFLAEAAKTA
jgi:hypothetical protein